MSPKVLPTLVMTLIALIFPQGSSSTQKSGECERALAQCQGTVSKLGDQYKALDRNYGSLKLELNEAKNQVEKWQNAYQQAKQNAGSNDCEQRAAAAQQEIDRCKKAYNDLSKQAGDTKQNDDLKNRLTEAYRVANDLKGRVDAAERETARYRQENAQNLSLISDLKNQAAELRRGPAELERQLNVARQDAEKNRKDNVQLSAQNADLRSRYSIVNSDLSNLKSQMSRLTLSESSLQQQLGAANLELTQSRSDNARLLATKTNLDLQVAELERQMKVAGVTVSKQPIPNPPTSPPPKDDKRGAPADLAYSPQALLKWSRTTLQEHSFGKEGRADLSYEKDGKTHHVRELVIGTLETEYDAKVRPGTSFPVKATFTPHPIMRIPHAADLYAWHLELDYQSSRIKDVQYNTEKSGRKARRREIVLDGPAETWVWELTAPADFQKDRSDIIVYAGYSIPNQEPEMMDITREPVELTEKETPSAFALALAFIKDNLTYILGLISVLVAIWATLISIKKGRLEVKLKEMELAPKA